MANNHAINRSAGLQRSFLQKSLFQRLFLLIFLLSLVLSVPLALAEINETSANQNTESGTDQDFGSVDTGHDQISPDRNSNIETALAFAALCVLAAMIE